VTVVGGVPRSGEQIQAALVAFVGGWKNYQGSEKGEAQTFLNQLFACYGTDRNAVGAKFEDFRSSAGFMDLHWPQVCIIEMKAPSRARSLYQAREQVMRYWRESADEVNDLPTARYVVPKVGGLTTRSARLTTRPEHLAEARGRTMAP
jgi:hypothetical protein